MPADGGASWASNEPARLPPQNVQAEQALLGALLANNKAFDRVGAFLSPLHFADPIHGRIYQAIARRVEKGQIADAVTLKAEFEHAGVLEEVGGVAYLGQLLTAMVSIINVEDYGRAIRDAWVRRQAIEIGEELVNAAYVSSPDARGEHIVTEAVEHLLALDEEAIRGTGSAVTLAAGLSNVVGQAQAAHRGDAGAQRLDVGIKTIDELWGGLWPGQLYYVAARSRTGKSPLMVQIARNIGARLYAESSDKRPEHVHVFSLEMTVEDFANINLTQTTRWSSDDIRNGRIGGPTDWLELEQAQRAVGRLPILVDDEPKMPLGTLLTKARVARRTHRTRLILIDHREIISKPKDLLRMGQPEWMPHLGYELKGLAKALNIPVVVFCQINKSRDREDDTRPTLGDLPYGGEGAADAVLALYRRELTMGDEPPEHIGVRSEEKEQAARNQWYAQRQAARGVAEFGALKRRYGPTAWRKFRFDGPSVTFSDPPSAPEAPPAGLFDDSEPYGAL